jgi:putative hydrolase of the HAD superfamily
MTTISFDLDGTLVTDEFTQVVWHQGIPELYAREHKCTFHEAQSFIFNEYSKVGDTALEWYDITYWLEFFKLNTSWKDLLDKFSVSIRTYPEVEEVLSQLTQSYQLIITSNAAREFLDTELHETGITPYFEHIFSATSDFKAVKKTGDFYRKICEKIHVESSQIVHVGDHYDFDFLVPQQLGITSFYLDRKGEKEGSQIVRDLNEFTDKLKCIPR